MNLQEHIRRVLKEETQLPSSFRRRVDTQFLNKIFNSSLKLRTLDFNYPKSVSYPSSLKYFAERVINDVMDKLEDSYHFDGLKYDHEYYWENIYPALYDYFKDRIKRVYKEHTGKTIWTYKNKYQE